MKHLSGVVFWVLFAQLAFAQPASRCGKPVSSFRFDQIKSQIAAKKSSFERLSTAKSVVTTNCLTKAQLGQILNFLGEDHQRLTIAMAAYPNVYDKEEVYELYDSFAYFSTAFRFRDFVAAQPGQPQPPTPAPQPNPEPDRLRFPNLYYPNPDAYNGVTNCGPVISDGDFLRIATNIYNQSSSARRLLLAKQTTANQCLSVAQVMKLASLLDEDDVRLDFLEVSFESVHDVGQMRSAVQVFSKDSYRYSFLNFLKEKNAQTAPSAPSCEVSESDMKRLITVVSAESFDDDRLQIAKQQLPFSSCYASEQIAKLAALFSFDEERLKFAKFAYQHVKDPEAYYAELSKHFDFASDKRALSNFINANRR